MKILNHSQMIGFNMSGQLSACLILLAFLFSAVASADVLRKHNEVEKRYGTLAAPAATPTWTAPAAGSGLLCPYQNGSVYTGMW